MGDESIHTGACFHAVIRDISWSHGDIYKIVIIPPLWEGRTLETLIESPTPANWAPAWWGNKRNV